jgi:hypothetical protein
MIDWGLWAKVKEHPDGSWEYMCYECRDYLYIRLFKDEEGNVLHYPEPHIELNYKYHQWLGRTVSGPCKDPDCNHYAKAKREEGLGQHPRMIFHKECFDNCFYNIFQTKLK